MENVPFDELLRHTGSFLKQNSRCNVQQYMNYGTRSFKFLYFKRLVLKMNKLQCSYTNQEPLMRRLITSYELNIYNITKEKFKEKISKASPHINTLKMKS